MKNKEGFTLIELILVLALMGIVLSILFLPIISSFKNFNSQNEKANIISDSRSLMDYLTREIRKADPETVKIDDGSLKIDKKGSLMIGLKSYELESGILSKDGVKVREGINDIIIQRVAEKIIMKITIEDYELSSEINLRTKEGD